MWNTFLYTINAIAFSKRTHRKHRSSYGKSHSTTNQFYIFFTRFITHSFWYSLQNKYFLVRDVTDDDDRLSTLDRSLVPNLRRCKGDFPVYGMGQPSQDGLQFFLQKLKDEGFKVRAETQSLLPYFLPSLLTYHLRARVRYVSLAQDIASSLYFLARCLFFTTFGCSSMMCLVCLFPPPIWCGRPRCFRSFVIVFFFWRHVRAISVF